MMHTEPHIKLELELPKTTLLQSYMHHSSNVDAEIKRGVEEAFSELTKDDSLANLVREHVKASVVDSIKSTCQHWDLKRKLTDAINTRVNANLEEVAEQYADQIIRGLDSALANKKL